MKQIILGDNAAVLPRLPERFARAIYIDPPFNTGKAQKRERMRVHATSGQGDRSGFGGKRYQRRDAARAAPTRTRSRTSRRS